MRLILSKRNQFEVAGVDGEFCCACRFRRSNRCIPFRTRLKKQGSDQLYRRPGPCLFAEMKPRTGEPALGGK